MNWMYLRPRVIQNILAMAITRARIVRQSEETVRCKKNEQDLALMIEQFRGGNPLHHTKLTYFSGFRDIVNVPEGKNK